MKCENGVLLLAAKMEALGPSHSRGRQINELRGGGCCLLAAGSITSPVQAVLWALEHKPGGILPLLKDLVPSLRLPTFSWNMFFTSHRGRFVGTMSMRGLSSEFLFKNKGSK